MLRYSDSSSIYLKHSFPVWVFHATAIVCHPWAVCQPHASCRGAVNGGGMWNVLILGVLLVEASLPDRGWFLHPFFRLVCLGLYRVCDGMCCLNLPLFLACFLSFFSFLPEYSFQKRFVGTGLLLFWPLSLCLSQSVQSDDLQQEHCHGLGIPIPLRQSHMCPCSKCWSVRYGHPAFIFIFGHDNNIITL